MCLLNRVFRCLAVQKGLQEVVEQLVLRAQVDINASCTVTENDFRALHLAVLYKQPHLIPLLMRLGADVNSVEYKRGHTPLLTAVVLNDELSVRLLAPYVPDATVFSRQGRNCLFSAAEKGNSAVLQLLLSKWGLDVDSPAEVNTQHTALHVACLFDKPHSVRYLLQAGANANAVNSSGQTPLDCARETSSFAAEAALLAFLADQVATTTAESEIETISE